MYSRASRMMSPIWWSLKPLTMVGDLQPGAAHVLDGLQLLFPERLTAGPAVDIVADAVELEVQGVQAGFLGLLGELQVGEHEPVGGNLGVAETHLLREPEDVEESGIDGGLAAGELDDPAGDRTFVAQCLEHLAHGFETGLVEVAGGVGVGEADRAGEVAAVGQVDIGQAGVGGVEVAEAAIVGAAGSVGDGGVLQAAVVSEGPLLHLEVEFDVGVDDVAEVAMVGAVLLHHHRAGVLKYRGIHQLRAIRSERPGLLRKPGLERLDGRTQIGSFRLYYLELLP